MQRITSPTCSTVLLCITVLEAHLGPKESSPKTRQAVSEPQSELSASVTGRSSLIFTFYCRQQHQLPLASALLAAGALQALQGAIRAQKLFYICCTLSFNGPARFHSSIRLPYCNHSPAYHHMFYVIWAHPSTQRHGSKRWLQTIHVEQKWAIITLNQRCHSATPAKRAPYLISHTEYRVYTKHAGKLDQPHQLIFPHQFPYMTPLAPKIRLLICNLIYMDLLQDPLKAKGLAQAHEGFSVQKRSLGIKRSVAGKL